jgi:hypothetical protein
MLPIDPGDGPGSVIPAQRVSSIVPPQAMAHGSTIIRPGAVAWGGMRDARDGGYSSCEAVERALGAVLDHPGGGLPGLLAELATSRLWVPLPVRQRPFTDGSAVRLPLIDYQGTDFVPCFTSVQRLTAWAELAAPGEQVPPYRAFPSIGGGRSWQRAGDARVVPHIVLPAVGLARRLPASLGLAINPDSVPGLPLFPECVPYLARRTPPAIVTAAGDLPPGRLAMEHLVSANGHHFLVGHPPAEPAALLTAARSALRSVPAVRQAARAWLSVPGQGEDGEGLVIAVTLHDPASEPDRAAALDAIESAAAAVALRVPFPVDVALPGEPEHNADRPGERQGMPGPLDAVDAWIEANARPFYTRRMQHPAYGPGRKRR